MATNRVFLLILLPLINVLFIKTKALCIKYTGL
jgi:hypothetical protein